MRRATWMLWSRRGAIIEKLGEELRGKGGRGVVDDEVNVMVMIVTTGLFLFWGGCIYDLS